MFAVGKDDCGFPNREGPGAANELLELNGGAPKDVGAGLPLEPNRFDPPNGMAELPGTPLPNVVAGELPEPNGFVDDFMDTDSEGEPLPNGPPNG